MKKHRILVLNLLTIIFFVAFAQNTLAKAPKEPIHIDLSKTLGFIMGQRFSLDRIKHEYPELSLQVKMTELEFNNSFGIAEKNIKKELKSIFKEQYPEYLAEMRNQMNNILKSQQMNQDVAMAFLEEVNLRSAGNIPSPMLEILLTYQFIQRPHNELLRGFKNNYRTKGHPKAKGLDLQIEYPISWSKREGKRPNVVQFFSSNNGRGPAQALIMVRDISKEAQGELTHEEIQALNTLEGSKELASEVFSNNGIIEMVNNMGMTNVRNINSKKIVMDRWPGAVLEFTGELQQLDFTVTMCIKTYFVIYKNFMIFLQGQVVKLPNETENELKNKRTLFDPLFRFMANSLVIQSQY
jgi:hypothetical protein